ncbi:hypothetical protein [Burkholderia cepacia]|uniref:hypothetical protein n=1 Tax=Burkholderia cepacia TaxID=292 RepID=UPI001F0FADB3|nr:hypothetical protein [Burkholderia cepacia]
MLDFVHGESSMGYNFDRSISRRNTNAMAEEGFANYLFGADAPALALEMPREELISMWVADMQFAAPDAAIDAITERLKLDRPAFRRHLRAIIYGNRGGQDERQAVHG